MRPLIKNDKGQALTEMLISLPVLCLFVAGILQFTILFLSYVQFEHACGEAAREYAAGLIDKDSLKPKIKENLGMLQRYFDPGSLRVADQEPISKANLALDKVRNAISAFPFLINYEGCEWSISIYCKPPFIFSSIFPHGILFQSVLQVYRYRKSS